MALGQGESTKQSTKERWNETTSFHTRPVFIANSRPEVLAITDGLLLLKDGKDEHVIIRGQLPAHEEESISYTRIPPGMIGSSERSAVRPRTSLFCFPNDSALCFIDEVENVQQFVIIFSTDNSFQFLVRRSYQFFTSIFESEFMKAEMVNGQMEMVIGDPMVCHYSRWKVELPEWPSTSEDKVILHALDYPGSVQTRMVCSSDCGIGLLKLRLAYKKENSIVDYESSLSLPKEEFDTDQVRRGISVFTCNARFFFAVNRTLVMGYLPGTDVPLMYLAASVVWMNLSPTAQQLLIDGRRVSNREILLQALLGENSDRSNIYQQQIQLRCARAEEDDERSPQSASTLPLNKPLERV